jgi:hypothetical protein
VGKKSREATIFDFTFIVQIAKWLLHGFSLEAVFLLGVGRASVETIREALGKNLPKGPLMYNRNCEPIDLQFGTEEGHFCAEPCVDVCSRFFPNLKKEKIWCHFAGAYMRNGPRA